MKKIIVSPSLLSCDFLNLKQELDYFKGQKNLWFHLDIMDGHFVPNLTFGSPIVSRLKKNTDIPLDAHFMVTNPEFYSDAFKGMGIYNFTFHWESTHHQDRLIQKLKKDFPSVGISLNPGTSPLLIPDYILKQINLILVMSVNPGFGGQSFIPGALGKIEYLAKKRKELKADFMIQVDGGIDKKTAPLVVNAGASNLVAGSYIFNAKQTEYLSRVKDLQVK